jgi:hypothetical protein
MLVKLCLLWWMGYVQKLSIILQQESTISVIKVRTWRLQTKQNVNEFFNTFKNFLEIWTTFISKHPCQKLCAFCGSGIRKCQWMSQNATCIVVIITAKNNLYVTNHATSQLFYSIMLVYHHLTQKKSLDQINKRFKCWKRSYFHPIIRL